MLGHHLGALGVGEGHVAIEGLLGLRGEGREARRGEEGRGDGTK